jgi:hypothetical protein
MKKGPDPGGCLGGQGGPGPVLLGKSGTLLPQSGTVEQLRIDKRFVSTRLPRPAASCRFCRFIHLGLGSCRSALGPLQAVDVGGDAEVEVGLRAGDGFLASSRLGCMIPFTDGRKARPAKAGQMNPGEASRSSRGWPLSLWRRACRRRDGRSF